MNDNSENSSPEEVKDIGAEKEAALRGAVVALTAMARTLTPMVPRAAQLIEQAIADIKQRWENEPSA